jgi:uncharacterized membrane protein
MADDLTRGVRSRAAIMGHPIHPMIVPFPIAFLVGTLVSDFVFASNGDPFWAMMSKWLLVGALVMAAVAAVLGLTDFASIKRAREGSVGWLHMGGNVIAVLLSLFSLIHRWNDPVVGVMPTGLTISVIVTGILLVTGWLGGELVFRYKIGVVENPNTASRDTRKSGLNQPHPAE